MRYSTIVLIIWNIVIINLYRTDKKRSLQNKWRISEGVLLVPAFLLGGVGALLGMILYKHKTKKLKFRTLVPLAILVNILTIWALYFLKSR